MNGAEGMALRDGVLWGTADNRGLAGNCYSGYKGDGVSDLRAELWPLAEGL